jgi:hypothetical protein
MVSNGIITNETIIAEEPGLVRQVVSALSAGLRDVIRNPAEAYLISAGYVDGLPLEDALRAALQAAAAEQAVWLEDTPDATRDAIAERRLALLDSLKAEFGADPLIQLQVLLASIELWDADQLGLTHAASWEQTQAILLDIGFMEAPLDDLASAYTNSFLPETDEG